MTEEAKPAVPGVVLMRLIEQLRESVESARSMPMSASVVLNKTDLLAQLGALESALPGAFEEAERLADRDGVAERARDHANAMIDDAAQEQRRLVSESEVVSAGREEAQQLREVAERECQELRRETDEYVDGRLANLELSLTKILEAVARGRERLHGRSDLDPLAGPDDGKGFAFPD